MVVWWESVATSDLCTEERDAALQQVSEASEKLKELEARLSTEKDEIASGQEELKKACPAHHSIALRVH